MATASFESSKRSGNSAIGSSHDTKPPESKTKPPPRVDLWKRAYDKLRADPETKALMEAYNEILQSMPTDTKAIKDPGKQMSEVVDTKLKYFKSGQWKVKIQGKEINVREKIAGIVNIILAVKDFGSTIAGLDPVHAGLPWAGVCVLLTVISNDSKQHSQATSGLKEVADIIPRYAAFENNLAKATYPLDAVSEVHERLTTLYALILRYQATSICFFGHNTFSRLIRSFAPKDDWNGILQKVKAAAAECEKSKVDLKWQSLEETLNQQTKNIGEVLLRIQQGDSERDRILSWVSKVLVEDDYHLVLDKKLGESHWGSGNWLLDNPQFINWESAESGVFWLKGAVGTGKSCLTSLVIRKLVSQEPPKNMAFFYCSKDTNRVSRTNPDDILRSIVAQLSYSKMGIVRNQWINRKFGSTLSEKDCTQLLATLIDTVGSSTVVIDALDECSDPYSLMEALRMISDELTKCASAHSLKIFISSREEDRVTADFPNAICISITQEETHKDMGSFIQNEISRRRAKINHRTQGESEQMTNDLAEKLRCILEGRAQSMFRWVELQLDLFLSLDNDPLHHDTIVERLAALERSSAVPELNDVYFQVYERNTADQNFRKLAVKALQLMLASFRPFTIDELISAVSIKVDFTMDTSVTKKTLVNRICSNFIMTDMSGSVQFTHLSVREFLKGPKFDEFSDHETHTQAAVSCLAILQQPKLDFHTVPNKWREGGLPMYAAIYWPFHCEGAKESRADGDLKTLFHSFVCRTRSPIIARWLKELPRLLKHFDPQALPRKRLDVARTDPGAFFLACHFGFIEALAKLPPDLNVRTSCVDFPHSTGLILAVINGHSGVVELLLRNGADIEAKDANGRTALSLASSNKHPRIISLLLKKNPKIEAGDSCGRTALSWAAENKLEDIFRLLLVEGGADFAVKDDSGKTVLHRAAACGNEEVVKILTEETVGVELNCKDKLGQTPLCCAVQSENETVVAKLFNKLEDLDVDTKDNYGQTPLSWASMYGAAKIVHQLLDIDKVDIDSKDNRGRSPLSWAAWSGHKNVVQLLTTNGAESDMPDDKGRTALDRADLGNHKEVVELLAGCGTSHSEKPPGATKKHVRVVVMLGDELEVYFVVPFDLCSTWNGLQLLISQHIIPYCSTLKGCDGTETYGPIRLDGSAVLPHEWETAGKQQNQQLILKKGVVSPPQPPTPEVNVGNLQDPLPPLPKKTIVQHQNALPEITKSATEHPFLQGKKIIKFIDCIGRRFMVPSEIYTKWTDMEWFIKEIFQPLEVLGTEVAKGHYELKWRSAGYETILPGLWEMLVEEDLTFSMHMWSIS